MIFVCFSGTVQNHSPLNTEDSTLSSYFLSILMPDMPLPLEIYNAFTTV